MKMTKIMPLPLMSLLLLLFFLSQSQAQDPPGIQGFTCNATETTTYSCQTYAFYRASMAQNYTDLASIGDLFEVSRLMIAEPSNISYTNVAETLALEQPLFVPLTCSCNSHNDTNISYANITYTIKAGNTFYIVSTKLFENLTTYQSVELVNPTLVPTNLTIGVDVIFPIFCKCPNQTQLNNQVNYLVSYVYQPSDNLSSIASRFEVDPQAIVDTNGKDNFSNYETLFIPVSKLPDFTQPTTFPSTTVPAAKEERTGLIRGLAIGLGIVGLLLILVIGFGFYRERHGRKKGKGILGRDLEKRNGAYTEKLGSNKEMEVGLMADVSDCLDKYKVFKIEELGEATDGFSSKSLIQGSVYKGCIDGEVYAIKKMKWNAYEELKILQKVNHGNLVKLEGFCIDPQDGNCYLIYEFVENGSLDAWLHNDTSREKLNWKTRLRIAIDVANGLQYIHEHTRPRVVHKDIKSSNILLESNMRAKIANFGLAKSGCNAITMHIVGTQGYIAPEYLADGVVSTKMDVFSFGVVLLELISGKEAIDENGKVMWASAAEVLEGSENMKMKKLRAWMDERLLADTISMESVISVMTVAVACISKDPSKRPTMVDIVYELSKSDDVYFDVSDDTLSGPTVVAR